MQKSPLGLFGFFLRHEISMLMQVRFFPDKEAKEQVVIFISLALLKDHLLGFGRLSPAWNLDVDASAFSVLMHLHQHRGLLPEKESKAQGVIFTLHCIQY